jgi:ABC-type transporter Mla MlaB component
LIVPGEPDKSVLLKRAELRGRDQMPPLATSRVDEAGVSLLREWIKSLKK